MSRLVRACVIGAGAGMAVIPADAAPWEFSGQVAGRAGYARNPFLQSGDNHGSVSVGGNIDGSLVQKAQNGSTAINGYYRRDQYLSDSTYSDDLGASVSHQQTFSERLTGNARLGYSNSRNAFTDVIDVVDESTLGSRRQSFDASASLQLQASARDSFGLSAFGNHASYSGRGLGDYDLYGVTPRYDRIITDRTTVGGSVTFSHTRSEGFGSTDTIQPNFNVTQKLSSYWTATGSIGLIFQKTDFGGFSSSSKTVGFDLNVCGKYPRWDVCGGASRQTAASGFGGLRTETSASIRGNYNIDERSRVSFGGAIGESVAEDRSFLAPKQRYASLDAGYSRDLNQRISAGADVGYRYRKFDTVDSAHGLTATVNLSMKIGRLK